VAAMGFADTLTALALSELTPMLSTTPRSPMARILGNSATRTLQACSPSHRASNSRPTIRAFGTTRTFYHLGRSVNSICPSFSVTAELDASYLCR
jgi:hypothetical protein